MPVVQETWIQSLGSEDLLEKEMATHSSILAWEVPWTEEPDGLQSVGSQRVRLDLATRQQQQFLGRIISTRPPQLSLPPASPQIDDLGVKHHMMYLACVRAYTVSKTVIKVEVIM